MDLSRNWPLFCFDLGLIQGDQVKVSKLSMQRNIILVRGRREGGRGGGLFTPAQITYNTYNTCPNLEVRNL